MRQHGSSDVSEAIAGSIMQQQFCANLKGLLFQVRHLIFLIHPEGTKNGRVHVPLFDMLKSLFVPCRKACSIIPGLIVLLKM